MKYNCKIIKFIASLALMLTCNSSFSEIVKGENSDSIYIRSSKKVYSKNPRMKVDAKKDAELLALKEFTIHAIKENLILPKCLDYLSEHIRKSIFLYSSTGNITGAFVLESYISEDNEAICVMEIPKSNLKNFESLDLSKNPRQILDAISEPRLLKIEIALSLEDKDESIALLSSSPLARAIAGRGLNGISQSWLRDIDLSENLSSLNDRQLLSALEASLGMQDLQALLLAEVEKRGYVKSAKFLAGHKVPTKDTLPACEEFLSTLDLNGLELSALSKILIENKCAIDFANVDIQDENFDAAKAEFAQKKPDFNKVIELIHASFLENVTDNAMNLLGRCYEEEGKFNEAMLCYFQTLSINPTQIYIKLNLANAFYALGNSENALLWAKDAVGDKTTSSWAKGEAKKLIEKIENPPVEDETSESENIEAPKEKMSESEVSQEKATEAEIHK